jgi:hypothetical protein
MRSQIALFSLIAATPFFLSGCSIDTVDSKDVQPDAVYQDLSLDYEEASQATTFSGTFRVGGPTGTTIDLQSPARFLINGQVARKESFLGTGYSLDRGGFHPEAVFTLTTQDGRELSNSIRIQRVTLVKVDSVVQAGQAFEVLVTAEGWNPSAESISATLSQASSRQAEGSAFQSLRGVFDAARGRILFSGVDTAQLSDGTADITIMRHRSQRLSQSTRAGGILRASYRLRPIAVTVVGGRTAVPQSRTP